MGIVETICLTVVILVFLGVGGLKYLKEEDVEKEDLLKKLKRKDEEIETLKAKSDNTRIRVKDLISKKLENDEISLEDEEVLLNLLYELNKE